MNKRVLNYTLIVVLLALTAAFVLAYENVPTPPNEDFTILSVSRRGYIGSKSQLAEAGNVTELGINVSQVTRGWQGYYGNISGVIVLDDSSNNTMYEWTLADPEGEIFASMNDSITWSGTNIICANIGHIQTEETALNFNSIGQDVDGINETFTETNHPAFAVGNNTFVADLCNFTVSTYVDDGPGARTFNETLLYSTAESSMVYMAYIFQGGSDGFQSNDNNYDFQMLVAEDGHDGDTTPTTYYFWVEVE